MAEANNSNTHTAPENKEPNGTHANINSNGVKPQETEGKLPSPPVTITALELEHLKKEAAEYKDKYLRVLAEAENARKRLQKERQELIQFAVQNVIADFLNPIEVLLNKPRTRLSIGPWVFK
jgi:molecular chaperone GrpE